MKKEMSHLGSPEKLSREDALQKGRKMKAEALGISIAVPQSSKNNSIIA